MWVRPSADRARRGTKGAKYRRCNHSATLTTAIMAGTSTNRPNHDSKRASGVQPKYCHRHSDCQLKIVAGRRKYEGGRLGIVCPYLRPM